MADISSNTVSRIEGGRSAMSIQTFIKLVQILDMDANELLGINLLEMENEELDSEFIFRIRNLRQNEQAVVENTIGALAEALRQCRT